MTAMISSLTEDQVSQLEFYREKWVDNGLNTDTLDVVKAKEILRAAYKSGGLAPPKDIYFAAGPREARDIFRKLYPYAEYREFAENIIYGNQESDWSGYVDYFENVVGLKLDNAKSIIDLAKHLSWTWVSADAAIMIDRPSHIRMDEQGLLHAENRASILYRDGFAVYSWHGQRIPKEWIQNPETLTASVALKQENIELRRAACEILGWANILEELNYTTIEEDEDPMIGKLIEVDLPDSGLERFLMVKCGTGRDFAIPVPPTMTTALNANAWTYGLEAGEYSPEIRT
jgi:hypothetical protein